MTITKLPPVTPDDLDDRRARVSAALSGKPLPPPDVPASKPTQPPRPPVGKRKDTLELYGQLLDQHAIVRKRMSELVTRPFNREESLRIVAAQLFKMMETIKEMQETVT